MPAQVQPSGEQFTIEAGGYRAVLTESGGALRQLTRDGVPVIDGFAADAMSSGGRGQLLMPWPNRIRDGRYSFGDRDLQLPLTEPARHNASHGLVRWVAWSVLDHAADAVTLGYRVMAQTGYPWTLDCTVRYALGDDGLTVTQGAVNRSGSPAPYAQGAHPYLTVGTSPVDGWELTVPAATRLVADPERKLPTGRESVDGTDYDFRGGRLLGSTQLDHAYTDLDRDASGRARVGVHDPGTGRGAELWVDEHLPWVMVYTGDDQGAGQARTAVAVEPMSAPADAFNSGDSLVRLDPGESFSATWGLRALG